MLHSPQSPSELRLKGALQMRHMNLGVQIRQLSTVVQRTPSCVAAWDCQLKALYYSWQAVLNLAVNPTSYILVTMEKHLAASQQHWHHRTLQENTST